MQNRQKIGFDQACDLTKWIYQVKEHANELVQEWILENLSWMQSFRGYRSVRNSQLQACRTKVSFRSQRDQRIVVVEAEERVTYKDGLAIMKRWDVEVEMMEEMHC